MAIELRLKKPDKSPWGFRLAGGADFDVPLTVIKVSPGSLAENAGMQVGDVVVRINDTAISPLTHVEAHDVIISSGNDFVMAVRRGDLSNLPPKLLLYDTEIEDGTSPKGHVFETDQQQNEADLNITDEEIATIIGTHVQSTQKNESESNVIKIEEFSEEKHEESVSVKVQESHVAKLVVEEQTQKQFEMEGGKKWSTFLQKPNNPKPKPKPKQEEPPKVAPYRVVIKKQPKKSEAPPKQSAQKDDVNNNENEIQEKDDIIEESAENFKTVDNEESELNETEEQSTEELVISEEIPSKDADAEYQVDEDEDEEERMRQEQSEKKLSVNLEEQLAEVQKQLLALSQLPSTIQQTLNAVTRQLSELVAASQQEMSIETNVRIEEELSIEEQTESVEYREQALSVLEEASCEEEETGQVTFEEAARTESDDEQALFEALERECEQQSEMESQIMTEEEMEAHRLEQERMEKKEKVNHWNNIWPWCDEDKPVYRINFLKYQPPPKNLDYLQKSAVYRLIHEIEPPPKGIVARDIKVLAEQDYYNQVEVSSPTPDIV